MVMIPATRRHSAEATAFLLRDQVKAAGGAVTAASGKAFLKEFGFASQVNIHQVRKLAGLGSEPGPERGAWVWFIESDND